MTPRLALFDLDGTLVDSQRLIVAAMGAAFDAVGRTPPGREAILSQVGLSLPVVLDRLSGGVAEAQRERMLGAYRATYFSERARAPALLFPGIRAALDALQARGDVRVGIATGASRRGMRAVIETHGLRPATAQCADDHPSKPDPGMVAAALAETGIRPGWAVMIGDSVHDMRMARAAGVFALGVGWGYQAGHELLAAGAEALVAEPGDLVRILDEHWEGLGD